MRSNHLASVMTSILVGVSMMVAGTSELVAQGKDPFVGTWEMNAAKSTFSTPAMAYKSSTLKIEAASNGQKVDVDTVGANGQPFGYNFTASFDGKDYPVEGIGTVTLKRVDVRTIERVHKRDGKPTQTFVMRVSQDGKTLTLMQTGTGPNGQVLKNQLLYERK